LVPLKAISDIPSGRAIIMSATRRLLTDTVSLAESETQSTLSVSRFQRATIDFQDTEDCTIR
jgi:hypothetical protein